MRYRLRDFKIEIEELSYDNRAEKDILYSKLLRYRKDCSEFRHELGESDETYKSCKKMVTSFKKKYSDIDRTFYTIKVSHRRLKKERVIEFVDRKGLRGTIGQTCVEVIAELNRSRTKTKEDFSKNIQWKEGRVYVNGERVQYKYSLIGLVHSKKGVFINLKQKHLVSNFFTAKKPKTKDNYIGVEIECYLKHSRDDIAAALFREDINLANKVHVKDDGSLRPQGTEKGVELAVLDTEEGIKETIISIGKVLKELNVRVGTACGLHVHIDMRHRIAEISFNNLVKLERIFYNMQPSERETNDYCRKTFSSNVYKSLRRGERYMAINSQSLQQHDTIEVRMHEGTADADVINNWITLLTKVCSIDKKITKTYRSIKSLCKENGFKKEIEDYINKRIKKYERAA
ncbi:MAG: hypothetical protein COB41_00125 [Proteobacteria bacterium]|nr:MAG: hypothetical protein COB41_00125 [Pseudomonadota bacterium]